MIDRYLSYAAQRADPIFEADFGPDKAVTEQLYRASDADANGSLTTIFGYWHATDGQLRIIANRLNKRGSDALVYALHPDILNPDPALVRKSFEEVAERSSNTVNNISDEYDTHNLLGFSLGNIALSMSTETINSFNKVTMVVPGADLLNCMYYGIRTKRLWQLIEKNGTTYKALEQEWASLAPINHLQPLIGHDVEVVLSDRDQFIPYRYGKSLIEAMTAAGIEPVVKTHKFMGHAVAILNYVRKM